MPLEALRRSITPIGMHYVLVHIDLPEVDTAAYDSSSTDGCATASR
jgi:sulfane dehydrogenase subunit SoxC